MTSDEGTFFAGLFEGGGFHFSWYDSLFTLGVGVKDLREISYGGYRGDCFFVDVPSL